MGHSRGTALRLVIITLLWTLAFLLLVIGTFVRPDAHWHRWLSWALFVGNAAIIPTMWEINTRCAKRHRVRVESLAQIMAQELARQGGGGRGGNVAQLR